MQCRTQKLDIARHYADLNWLADGDLSAETETDPTDTLLQAIPNTQGSEIAKYGRCTRSRAARFPPMLHIWTRTCTHVLADTVKTTIIPYPACNHMPANQKRLHLDAWHFSPSAENTLLTGRVLLWTFVSYDLQVIR